MLAIALPAEAQEHNDPMQQVLVLGEWLEYGKALAAIESLPQDSLSQYNKIRLLVLSGDYQRAIKETDVFFDAWPNSAMGINCKWQRAYSLKKIGLCRDALFDYLELARLDTLLSDIAWINVGLCFQQEGYAGEAKAIFDSLSVAGKENGGDSLLKAFLHSQATEIKSSPSTNKGTIYQASRLIGRKKYESARKLLDRFVRYNKGNSFLGQAQYLIGKCLERQGRLTQATEAYLKVPVIQPNSTWSDEAVFRAGWCQYKLKSFNQALKTWQQVQDRYPSSDFAEVAAFWQAKTLQRIGDSLAAKSKYLEVASKFEYSYYGWRAREKLNGLFLLADSLCPEKIVQLAFLDSAVSHPQVIQDNWIKDHRRFNQAQRLVDLGLFEEAGKLAGAIRKISWNDPVALHYLAQLYSQAGMDPIAIYCAKRSFDLWMGPKPRSLLKVLYPKRYLNSIETALIANPIEAALVLSVMRQESKFVANARSRAGARGLMQIMPKTGKRLSGLKKFKPDTLYHPETSIAYGTRFLAGLIRQFDGSIIHSLAAYNAGPQRVKQWLKSETARKDEDYLIEEIPYLETRNYIKKVMMGYYIYRWLLEGKT
jgi:soluble lytic murein transglycosylase